MLIKRLKLSMFKGIREFEVNFKGHTNIYGDNETGKTTLYDAFTWLLFGKDSLEQAKFDIKTIVDGKPISKAEHSVEAVLWANNKPITLKKVYYEKWTKERGAPEAVFTGHSTDYYIDGVPVKEKDYLKEVDELCNQKLFRLISNPLYFNEVLSWQERRQLLVEMSGGVTEDAIFTADSKLSDLKKILNNRNIDDYKKILNERRKIINKQIEEIPKRIDENIRMKPDLSGIDFTSIQAEKTKLESELQSLQGKIIELQNGSIDIELKKQIAEIDLALMKVKNEYEEKKQNAISEKAKQRDELKNESQKGYYKRLDKERELTAAKERLAFLEKEIALLREKYTSLYKETPKIPEIENLCFACGQPIPEEKIKEAEEKYIADFNEKKSKELESTQTKGKTFSTEQKELTAKMTAAEEELKAYDNALTFVNTKISELQAEIDNILKYQTTPEETESYVLLVNKKNEIKAKQENLYQPTLSETAGLRELIESKKNEIAKMSAIAAQQENSQKIEERIKELEQELKDLSDEWQKSEKELYLVENYIRLQTSLLEEKINSMFKMANFRMFENQVNGGLKEVCEVTYKDVPYSSLNNAARINIGLDVINTISKHYGMTAPVWIDNAESVTKYVDTETQVIKLIVSENDKKLRVEG